MSAVQMLPFDSTAQKSDEELIADVAHGCLDSFEELARRHQGRFHAIARGILRNSHDAADVVQTAMLKMFTKSGTFNAEGSFAGWSSQIVRNEALMLIRRRKRRSESPLDDVELRRQPDETVPAPDQVLRAQRLREALSDAVDKLSPKYRVPFELKNFEGLSVLELADRLELSEGGIKTRLYRARAHLKKSLMRQQADVVRSVINV